MMKRGVVLEPLRVVEAHQRDQAFGVADAVLLGEKADLSEELLERRVLALLPLDLAVDVELARDAHELLQVLHPPLGLERALGFQRVEVARVVEDRLEQLGDRVALGSLTKAGHDGGETRDRLDRRRAQPRHGLGPRHDVPDVLARRVDVGEDAAL